MRLREKYEQLLNELKETIYNKRPFDLMELIAKEHDGNLDRSDLLYDLPYMMFSDNNGYYQIHTSVVSMNEEGILSCEGTGEEYGKKYTIPLNEVPIETLVSIWEIIS